MKKRKFKVPHTLVVLFSMVVWAFPSGSEAALAFDPLQYQLGRAASGLAWALLLLIEEKSNEWFTGTREQTDAARGGPSGSCVF